MRRVFLAVAVAGVLVVSAGIPSEAVHIGPRTTGGIRSMAPLINCSTPLKLYDGTSLTGATVSVYARGVWINLSGVNFDNRTSSYKVGACSIELATGTNGSGSHYTRCLSAGCEEDTMASGWNNVVSSVYLHQAEVGGLRDGWEQQDCEGVGWGSTWVAPVPKPDTGGGGLSILEAIHKGFDALTGCFEGAEIAEPATAPLQPFVAEVPVAGEVFEVGVPLVGCIAGGYAAVHDVPLGGTP